MTVTLQPHLQLNIHLHRQQQQSRVHHRKIQVQRNICVEIHRSTPDCHRHYVFKQVYHLNVVPVVYGHRRIFILIQCGLFQVLQQQQQHRLAQHRNDYLYKIHHRRRHYQQRQY